MALLPESSIDRRLLEAQRSYKTPNEMSEAVLRQLSPAECAVRVQDLLNSKTVLDEVQERRALLIGIAEHVEWLKTKRDDPKTWGNISRGMKLLSDQIERTNLNIDDVSTKLAEAHAQTYVEAYMRGFNALLDVMAERGIITVEPGEVAELTQLGISASSEYIQGQTQRVIA